jgi:hypothetical protein
MAWNMFAAADIAVVPWFARTPGDKKRASHPGPAPAAEHIPSAF